LQEAQFGIAAALHRLHRLDTLAAARESILEHSSAPLNRIDPRNSNYPGAASIGAGLPLLVSRPTAASSSGRLVSAPRRTCSWPRRRAYQFTGQPSCIIDLTQADQHLHHVRLVGGAFGRSSAREQVRSGDVNEQGKPFHYFC